MNIYVSLYPSTYNFLVLGNPELLHAGGGRAVVVGVVEAAVLKVGAAAEEVGVVLLVKLLPPLPLPQGTSEERTWTFSLEKFLQNPSCQAQWNPSKTLSVTVYCLHRNQQY